MQLTHISMPLFLEPALKTHKNDQFSFYIIIIIIIIIIPMDGIKDPEGFKKW